MMLTTALRRWRRWQSDGANNVAILAMAVTMSIEQSWVGMMPSAWLSMVMTIR